MGVLQALDTPLIEEAKKATLRPMTTNNEALDLYLRARNADQRWELEENNKATALYEKAIELDPNFALAYVALAQAIQQRRQIASLSPDDPYFQRSKALLEKALQMDPNLGDAHALLGRFLLDSFDILGAERELLLAEKLNPNGDIVLEQLAQYYSFAGWPPQRAVGDQQDADASLPPARGDPGAGGHGA